MVVKLYKNENKQYVQNYQPISMSHTFSTMLEKVIKAAL